MSMISIWRVPDTRHIEAFPFSESRLKNATLKGACRANNIKFKCRGNVRDITRLSVADVELLDCLLYTSPSPRD